MKKQVLNSGFAYEVYSNSHTLQMKPTQTFLTLNNLFLLSSISHLVTVLQTSSYKVSARCSDHQDWPELACEQRSGQPLSGQTVLLTDTPLHTAPARPPAAARPLVEHAAGCGAVTAGWWQ